MTQKGIHTWDMTQTYHLCPTCGHIVESRDEYMYHAGKWSKPVKCDQCGRTFTETKKQKASFGPLFGDPQPPEVTWN